MGAMLTLPADNRYRNAFLPPETDHVFVDTDYSSVEIVFTAYLSQDPIFLRSIEEDIDLHSLSARLLFGDKWLEAAESNCSFEANNEKCECPKHAKMRTASKAITFGIFFGLGPSKLSDNLGITLAEGKGLMETYFKTFPAIKEFFSTNAALGIQDLCITGIPPYSRKRFFNYPEDEQGRAAIGRQSQNFVIQEACAGALKTALIYLTEAIDKNKLPVKLHLAIHDEILTSCPREFGEQLKRLQEDCMIRAAKFILPYGKFKCETKISDVWVK